MQSYLGMVKPCHQHFQSNPGHNKGLPSQLDAKTSVCESRLWACAMQAAAAFPLMVDQESNVCLRTVIVSADL